MKQCFYPLILLLGAIINTSGMQNNVGCIMKDDAVSVVSAQECEDSFESRKNDMLKRRWALYRLRNLALARNKQPDLNSLEYDIQSVEKKLADVLKERLDTLLWVTDPASLSLKDLTALESEIFKLKKELSAILNNRFVNLLKRNRKEQAARYPDKALLKCLGYEIRQLQIQLKGTTDSFRRSKHSSYDCFLHPLSCILEIS
jgi:hypothetical protein